MTGLLVIMGSGETAPTMVKPHRSIFTRVGEAAAVLLDTPYGFQENADDISARAVAYFAASVGRDVSVVSWRTPPEPGLDRERALAALDEAGWVFAGPGSPTYALRQWVDTPIPEALAQTAQRQGVVVFASAAALTLGSHTVPVYEIYKAGHAACWVPGLDLVRRLTGLPAVVIPHYDNAEGGHHDTRFCYLGERRLSRMEQELPPEAFVLGVDEHTAVLLDLTAGTVSVVGNGVMTIRHGGHSIRHPAGEVIAFEALLGAPGAPAQGGGGQPHAAADQAAPDDGQGKTPAGSLRGETVRLEDEFARAHQGRDVDGCVSALLELEQVLLDWAADTLTSDEGEYARAALRRMVVRLGKLASRGVQDPREAVAPYVDALLELRQRARAGRDYATSDWVRDRLTAAGIEVRDTADGVSWAMAEAG